MDHHKGLLFALVVLAAVLVSPMALQGASVDIVVVVDESGSMAGEHAWLPGMIGSLDTELTGLGHTTNYGLFGFGSSGATVGGRTLLPSGSAGDFATSASGLVTSGATEDGYSGLNFASNNFQFTGGGAAVNYILVTDEDRDTLNAALTYATTLALLQGQGALLNAVVNNAFACGANAALGMDSDDNGYQADGSGGFTACAPGTVGSGAGTTTADYVDLAFDTGGAGWDLNLLRAGGDTATSFTNAFIDIKVQEIQQQIQNPTAPAVSSVPEPSTVALLGGGLLALFTAARRRRK